MTGRSTVVVIGAGYAGLTAALCCRDAGLTVAVLEARPRVGGRVHTEDLGDGLWLDHGGQWVGPTQRRLLALADRYGVDRFPTYTDGEHIDVWQGVAHRYSGPLPNSDPDAMGDAIAAMLDLDLMALQVPLEAPWQAPEAAAWDAVTVASWIDTNVDSAGGRANLALAVQAVWSCEPADLSLLHLLFYVRAAGGLAQLLGIEGAAQAERFVGGAQSVADRIAGDLGSAVHTNTDVLALHDDEAGVTVAAEHAGSLQYWRADRVVVALPPTLAGRLRYSPPLPAARDQLTQRMPMGTVLKVHAVYPTPFWREAGLTGRTTADAGAVRVTFDNSVPGDARGVLLAFVEGAEGRRLLSLDADTRRKEVLADLVSLLGAAAGAPLGYHERSWADEPYTRGCYAGLMVPGGWTGYGPALRAPVGRLHWAGTETATVWNGYIDGAVQSGERAAREVLAALGVPAGDWPPVLPESGGR